MPKLLCIIPLVISILVVLLFLFDLVFGLMGNTALAPFKYNSMMIDIVFTISGLIVGTLSWFTLRDQV